MRITPTTKKRLYDALGKVFEGERVPDTFYASQPINFGQTIHLFDTYKFVLEDNCPSYYITMDLDCSFCDTRVKLYRANKDGQCFDFLNRVVVDDCANFDEMLARTVRMIMVKHYDD